MIFKPHSDKQEQAIFSQAKITACITGIQWGKTTVGAVWLKRQMHRIKDPEANFLVTAPTYKIMDQATLPAFIRVMQGLGTYNAQLNRFKTSWGPTVFFRTGVEPDSVIGITNVHAIWGDEAGKYTLYFWDNIQGRASLKDAPIMLTTSPYTLNWLYKQYVKVREKYTVIISAKSIENPYFSKDDYFRRKAKMDERRFRALYDGVFEKMQGLVYDCFDEDTHVCDPVDVSAAKLVVAGVDWGYTNPFALLVRAVMQDGKQYQISESYESLCTITDKIRIAKAKMQQWGIDLFVADPSEPSDIEEFNRAGLPTIAANNDIHKGVQAHYELIKSGRFKIFAGTSPHSLDEYSLYHYPEPEDLRADDDLQEDLPVKQDDHAMDATRYITVYLLSEKYKQDKNKYQFYESRVRGSVWMPRKEKPERNEVW